MCCNALHIGTIFFYLEQRGHTGGLLVFWDVALESSLLFESATPVCFFLIYLSPVLLSSMFNQHVYLHLLSVALVTHIYCELDLCHCHCHYERICDYWLDELILSWISWHITMSLIIDCLFIITYVFPHYGGYKNCFWISCSSIETLSANVLFFFFTIGKWICNFMTHL